MKVGIICFSASAGLAFTQTLSGSNSSAGKKEELHLLRILLKIFSCFQRVLHGLLMHDRPSQPPCHLLKFISQQKACGMDGLYHI